MLHYTELRRNVESVFMSRCTYKKNYSQSQLSKELATLDAKIIIDGEMDQEEREANTASSMVNPDKNLESPGEARCIHAHGKITCISQFLVHDHEYYMLYYKQND